MSNITIKAADLTARDTFAIVGMGLIFSTAMVNEKPLADSELATRAYELADAMMDAREATEDSHFAAAPDLYKALEACVERLQTAEKDSGWGDGQETVLAAQKVLAAARGEGKETK